MPGDKSNRKGTTMRQLLLGGTLSLLLASCVTLTQSRSAQQSTMVTDVPDVAYAKATKAVIKMGGHITTQDTAKRVISARLNKAVVLGILLTPDGTGTLMDARGTAEAGYVLPKDIDQYVQEFLMAYKRE
jgi:hypothetical protein